MTDTQVVFEPRLKLIPFTELVPGDGASYLVKGLIPRVGLIVIWGPPKCGKSFWTFDVALHVALKWLYRGRRVKGGAVVYCAFEGAEGFRVRAEAFRQKYLADDHEGFPFYLMPTRVDLIGEHEQLIAAIEAQLPKGVKPVLLVLDTLNRSLVGSESSDEDMAAYVRAADAIREKFECAVAIVHHCGIEGSRPRGHTSLTGAADAQLAVKRDGAGHVTVTVEWMKEGPEGEVIASQLEQVEVGTDEDGDPITSCVVVPVDAGEICTASAKSWSKGLRLVRECITAAAAEYSFQHAVEGDGPTVSAVYLEDARDKHRQRYLHGGDAGRDAAGRQAWSRNIKEAQKRQLIGSAVVSGREAVWVL